MKNDVTLAEWHRAQEALRAAIALTDVECFADAISRTYYAVFHGAKAALHALNVETETHPAVRRMFGLHLIKTGQIEKEYAVILGDSFDDRLAADYDPKTTFSRTEARHECKLSRQFLKRIRQFLLAKGFSKADLGKKK